MSGVRRIEPVFVERVWGRTNLAPLFGTFDRCIGEVWFPLGDDFPLLIKFIFTHERLSVQVHPDDDYAREHENSWGKTEMWHILAADPGATIGLGFKSGLTREELATAIADGTLVDRLNWVPVRAGDTLLAPAGVVHAIGAGIVLCEIQQNSDVTYRLFDYGRQRALHLERGLEVADPNPFDGRRELPVSTRHFTTELTDGSAPPRSEHILIALAGHGTINEERFEPGSVWVVPQNAEVNVHSDEPVSFLRTRSGGTGV